MIDGEVGAAGTITTTPSNSNGNEWQQENKQVWIDGMIIYNRMKTSIIAMHGVLEIIGVLV
jgi:hypothetical protein